MVVPRPCPNVTASGTITSANASFCLTDNSSLAVVSPAGTVSTFDPVSQRNLPTICAAGLLCDQPGVATSQPCPAGSYCPSPLGSVRISGRGGWICPDATKPLPFDVPGSAIPACCPLGSRWDTARSKCRVLTCATGSYLCATTTADHCCSVGQACDDTAGYCAGSTFSPFQTPAAVYVAPTVAVDFGLVATSNKIPCPAGFHCDASGLNAPRPCPDGYLCNAVQSPQPCPRGTYCMGGISTPCPIGSMCPRLLDPNALYCADRNQTVTPQRVCCPIGWTVWYFYCFPPNGGCPSDLRGCNLIPPRTRCCPPAAYNCEPYDSYDQGPWDCYYEDNKPTSPGVFGIPLQGYVQPLHKDSDATVAPTPCPPGRDCSLGGLPQSRPCTDGTYCVNGFSVGCPIGSYCTATVALSTGELSTPVPLPCPVGTLCTSANLTLPVPCPAGHSCPSLSQPPVGCPIGQFCQPGALGAVAAPTPCAPGMLCNSTNLLAPLSCPFGYFCPVSPAYVATPSSQAILCPQGSYCFVSHDGASTLEPVVCPSGYLCDAPGLVAPKPCPDGRYCPDPSTGAVDCPAGAYCARTSISYCNMTGYVASPPGGCCPIGFTLNPSTSNCDSPNGGCGPSATRCDGNHASCCPASSDTVCNGYGDCVVYSAAGYKLRTYEAYRLPFPNGVPLQPQLTRVGPTIAPTACPEGMLCTANSAVPAACPSGSFCPIDSATYHVVASSQALPCPIGSLCQPAAIGALALPSRCPPGKLCAQAGLVEAQPCPEGQYCPPLANLSAGTVCLAPADGQCIDGAIALDCPAGSICSSSSTSGSLVASTPCPEHQVCPNRRMTAGIPCASGRACDRPGMARFADCQSGFYSADASDPNSECTKCDTFWHQPIGAQTSCQQTSGAKGLIAFLALLGAAVLCVPLGCWLHHRRGKLANRAQGNAAAGHPAAASRGHSGGIQVSPVMPAGTPGGAHILARPEAPLQPHVSAPSVHTVRIDGGAEMQILPPVVQQPLLHQPQRALASSSIRYAYPAAASAAAAATAEAEAAASDFPDSSVGPPPSYLESVSPPSLRPSSSSRNSAQLKSSSDPPLPAYSVAPAALHLVVRPPQPSSSAAFGSSPEASSSFFSSSPSAPVCPSCHRGNPVADSRFCPFCGHSFAGE